MVHLTVLQLLLYNFLQNHIKWVVIFHCWDLKTQLQLIEIMMSKNIYMDLRTINNINFNNDLERHYLRHNQAHVGVFVDFNCDKSQELLKKTSSEKLFKQDFHWLIYDENSDISLFRQLFGHFNMAVDADVTYAYPNPEVIETLGNTSFITYDVYNNGYFLGGQLNMTQDGEIECNPTGCSLKRYLSTLHEKSKYENRWSVKDITMRVSTVVTYLLITEPEEKLLKHLSSLENRHLDGVARFGFHYLMLIKESLDCKFFYNFTSIWSRTELTGGCIGAIGVEHTADLASSAFLPTPKRFPYVQPTFPLGNFRQVCIFRTPRNAGIRGEVYLEPFSLKVWLLFAGILMFTAVLLWLTFVVEVRQLKLYLNYLPSLLTTTLVAFGSACYQGSFIVPSSVGGRISFFSLSLLTFIMYNYYTSIVVAILLGSPVKSSIKTMAQLAESNLEVALEPIPYTKSFFNFSMLPEIRTFVRNKIKSRKNPDSVWLPVAEGLRRVRDEPGFVYGTESFSGYELIEKSFTAKEICDLNEVLMRPMQVLHTHLPKNSSYYEILRLKQARILESGIHRRLQQIWVRARLNCYVSNSFSVQVGLEYTAPLFLMLGGSYILVIVLMLIEILWSRYLTTF